MSVHQSANPFSQSKIDDYWFPGILYLRSVKVAVEDKDGDRLQHLINSDFPLDGGKLLEVLEEKMSPSPWVQEEIYGQIVYIDVNTGSFSFHRPEGYSGNQSFSTATIKVPTGIVGMFSM